MKYIHQTKYNNKYYCYDPIDKTWLIGKITDNLFGILSLNSKTSKILFRKLKIQKIIDNYENKNND